MVSLRRLSTDDSGTLFHASNANPAGLTAPAKLPTAVHLPDFETFRKLAKDGMLVPVYRRLVCDSLTPVSAFHKIDSGRCACLFESVVGGEKVGRYSFLAADPFFEIEAYGPRVTTNSYSGVSASGGPLLTTRSYESADPMAELRRHVEALRAVHLPELPPFCAGAVGYAGYDTVRYFERLPNAPPDDRQVPDLAFAFYDRMVVFDNVAKTIVVVAMARLDRPGRRSNRPMTMPARVQKPTRSRALTSS